MPGRILDTSELIHNWHRCRRRTSRSEAREAAQEWARELIGLHDSSDIVTPVFIEFIAGVRSKGELDLARAYLAEFEIIDEGRILEEDWEHAKRLAARIPRDGKPRQLGDCLILAIAIRLNCDVRSLDKGFKR